MSCCCSLLLLRRCILLGRLGLPDAQSVDGAHERRQRSVHHLVTLQQPLASKRWTNNVHIEASTAAARQQEITCLSSVQLYARPSLQEAGTHAAAAEQLLLRASGRDNVDLAVIDCRNARRTLPSLPPALQGVSALSEAWLPRPRQSPSLLRWQSDHEFIQLFVYKRNPGVYSLQLYRLYRFLSGLEEA